MNRHPLLIIAFGFVIASLSLACHKGATVAPGPTLGGLVSFETNSTVQYHLRIIVDDLLTGETTLKDTVLSGPYHYQFTPLLNDYIYAEVVWPYTDNNMNKVSMKAYYKSIERTNIEYLGNGSTSMKWVNLKAN